MSGLFRQSAEEVQKVASEAKAVSPSASQRRFVQERHFVPAALAPGYLLVGVVIILPLVVALYTSLFSWNLQTSPRPTDFAGLRNYIGVFSHPMSRQILLNTAKLCIVSIAITTTLGLSVALLLNQQFLGRGLLRSLLLLPWAIPGIAAATMWWWLYSTRYGILNYLLVSGRIIDVPVNWLLDYPMLSIVLADVWKEMPFSALLFLAGLQGISPELYEAAMVDGANALRRFMHITVPMLRNMSVVVLIFQTATSLKMFDLIFAMTAGGPSGATTTLGYWAYLTSFRYWDFGFGTAIAFAVAVLVLLASGTYMVSIYRRVEV